MAGRAALHVSPGQRAAAAVDCSQRDRSPSTLPGSAAAARAESAAPAEHRTQVKAPEARKVRIRANRSLSKLQLEKAALSLAGAQLAAGFWSGCLSGTESALRAPQRALHPLFKKSACLCITLPEIRGLHFEWSSGGKGDEVRDVGGCPAISLWEYLLPVLVADKKEL